MRKWETYQCFVVGIFVHWTWSTHRKWKSQQYSRIGKILNLQNILLVASVFGNIEINDAWMFGFNFGIIHWLRNGKRMQTMVTFAEKAHKDIGAFNASLGKAYKWTKIYINLYILVYSNMYKNI